MTLGPVTDGTITPVTVPVIKFRPYEDFTLHAIHLPISNVENIGAPSISWYIYDDISAPALIEGDIHQNSISKMIIEENLLINIGTFQTDPADWINGFNVTGGNYYYLKLDGNGANFAIKTSSNIFSTITLSDDTESIVEKPELTLYSGQNLGRSSIDNNGSASKEVLITPEDRYIIAEYGEMSFLSPSYDFKFLNVTGAPPPPPPPVIIEENETEIPPPPPIEENNGDNETEIPLEENNSTNEEEIVINPDQEIIIIPPNDENDQNSTTIPVENSTTQSVDEFETEIPANIPEPGSGIAEYIDIIAIAGLQGIVTLRKFKKA